MNTNEAAIGDLDIYTKEHGLDGFVVGGRIHLLKSSPSYTAYLLRPGADVIVIGD